MVNLLLVIGCVLGVIGGAAPRDRLLMGIPLNWALAGAAGVVLLAASLLRSVFHVESRESESGKNVVGAARDAVVRVADDVRALLSRAVSLPIDELAREIDALIARDLYPVIEAQPKLIAEQGYRRYAAHTGPWAGGERMLYRAWSAATDGHRPETIASLQEALPHFEEARALWGEESAGSGRAA